jgi:ElaA protein
MTTISVAPPDALADCLAIRRVVFIEEQGVSVEDEVDGLDPDCTHLIARDGDGRAVGTLRLRHLGDTMKIQRVAVLADQRGTGLGAALIRAALDAARAAGAHDALLGAQTHALRFYERLGFTAEGPVYDDAGIPHRDMRQTL